MKTKRGKCPKCLPDGGAIFTSTYDCGEVFWECNNCHYQIKCRKNNPTPKVTPSQKEVIERLNRAGWKLENEATFIGRALWVSATKDRGNAAMNLFSGDMMYGTINPRGKFKLTLMRFGGDVVVTDSIGFSVYLEG